MAWEQHYRQRYYTRSQRVGGRVKRTYIGKGVEGKLAEALDQQRRADRRAKLDAERALAAEIRAIGEMTRELARHAADLADATLLAAGFHRHDRGNWRRRNNRKQEQLESQGEAPAGFAELLDRAKKNDQSAIARLGEFLNAQIDVWMQANDMAAKARESLIAARYDKNLAAAELARHKMNRLQADLAGVSASPIVFFLAETCAICQFQLCTAEAALVKQVKMPFGAGAQKALGTIHKRLLRSLRQLDVVQRLLTKPRKSPVTNKLMPTVLPAATAMAG